MRTGVALSATAGDSSMRLAAMWRSPAEQIRKGMNLLMIFSMLLSTLSPIYAPVSLTPSFASLDELRAFSALVDLADAPGALLGGGAEHSKRNLGGVSAGVDADHRIANADKKERMPPKMDAALPLESALTPDWLKTAVASAQNERQVLSLESLGSALTPAWLSFNARAQNPSFMKSSSPEHLVPGQQGDLETVSFPELNGAAAAFARAEKTVLEVDSLGAFLSPSWMRARSNPGGDMEGIVYSPPEEPWWATLNSADGICTDPDFALYHHTPVSMTMGNATGLYTFTAVLTNTSATSAAGPLTFTLSLPANLTFVGNSASAINNNSALQVTQPANNMGGTIAFVVSHASPLQTLPPGGVVTFTYRLVGTPVGGPNPDLTVQVNGGGTDPDCTVADAVNTNYCPLPGQLPLALTPPPHLVSMGNSAGDQYTVTLTNNGAYTLTDVSFSVSPSLGYFFIGNSAVMTHSVYGSLSVTQPASNTAEGAGFVVRVGNPYPANALAPGETITLVIRLGTTANAKSGQPLVVAVRSGRMGAELQCTETRENIATGRGNLFLRKSVSPSVAAVGEVVTFTIRVDNTGLGDLYEPIITDTLGPGLLSAASLTYSQPLLRPNEAFTYTITAEVAACTGVTNTALASWTIGNDNGQATANAPVSDTVNVRILNPLPQIAVQAQAPEVAYCQPAPYSVNVPVTVTNSSKGAAAAFALNATAIGGGPALDFSTTTPGWVVNGGVISYTANNGLLRGNQTVTLTLTITYAAPVCNANAGAIQLTPQYADACFPAIRLQGQPSTISLNSPNAPTLAVEKASSLDADLGQIVQPGDTVYFTVTVSGNTGVLSGSQLLITDVLPGFFPTNWVTVTTPGAVYSGGVVTYAPTIASEPTYAFTLTMEATYPQAQCTLGAVQNNVASATSPFCTACLNGQDQTALVFADWDPLYPGSRMTAVNVLLDKCRTTAQQTVVISMNQPITWATAIFTDPLTANGVGPVEVVSGSVQVFVDGVDRTQDVTITTAPTLSIAFGNIGVYSATALITITYELTAPVTATPGVGWYFVDFAVGGYEDGVCGGVRRAPVRLEVRRSTYQLVNVSPDTLNSCSVNQVFLNFDGAFYPGLNRELVAIFQTDVGDVITPSALTLSGSLAGQNVTVTTGIVGGQQVVTFTLAPTAPLIGPGAISFPLYRACASTTPISATLIAPDYCQVPVISNDTGGAVTLRPHVVLSLFGGGSVQEREQEWGFIVRNYGAVTATNVIVTNTLPVGFIYTGHAPTGVTVQTGTFGVRQTLTFTVPAIAPFSDVEVTITGTAQSCLAADQLWAGMTTSCGAVGPNPGADFCQGVQLASLNYKEAEGILLTSNDQAAIIPLCGIGDVTLIVKNATLDNELYNFFLREVLTDTVYVPGSATISLINDGNVILPATPFTPTTIFPLTPTLPYTQVLIWDSQEMTGYPQSLIDALAARGGKDEIHITFQVRTYCTSPNPMVAADGSAANACGTRTFKSEDARSVLVSYPSVSASKTVRNLSEGGPAASRVFAAVGDQLVWNVTVNNISTVDVRALLVTDTLPGNVTPSWFNVTAVSPITTSQAGRILNWVVYSDTTPFTPALPALTTRSFLITGTVSPAVCTQPLVNEGAASVGCSLNDVCPAEPYAAQAEIDINPNFSIAAADAILDQCAPGPLTLSITNNGARSDNVIVTYTLPAGFAYAGLAPSTNPMPAISPTVGVTGALVFSYTAFDQLSTATLAISVTNDLQSAGACRVAGSGSATLSYYDTCGVYYPNAASDGYNVTVRRSDISSLNIRPISQTVEASQRYTWTIALTNTGDSPTNNLVVTATVGNGWAPASLIVSNGTSLNTSTPPVTATVGDSIVVTWAVGSLPINEPWTAQLSAIAVGNQTNYRIRAEASTVCNDGGCTSAFSDIAYNIPFQAFGKSMIGSAVSIAEPFTYTITADFYGNVQYTDTVLLDRLPQLFGTPIFSVTGIVTTNINSANAWTWQNGAPQAITFTTSSVTRTVFGPDRLTITVTGFISNAGAAQQGLSFTNHITLSTSHDGQRWVYTDAATGSIKEPILQIDKSVTPYDNVRIDSVLTYTLSIYHAWNSDATAYDVVITDIVPSVLSYVPGTLQVSSPAGSVVSATIGNSLIITVSEYPVSPSPILVTYQATVTLAAEPATYYPNNAYVRWTSQPGMNPYERTGNGLGPNDYWDGASATFATALLDQRKVVEANVLPTVGDAITYTVAVTVPVGTVRNLVITDNLPAGFVYSPSVSFITVTTAPPLNLPPYTVTTPNATQFVLRFNAPITNTTNGTAVISWTFRLLVDNSASIFHGASKTNIAVLSYSNGQNTTFAGSAWAPSISIYEPLLHIGKHYVTADACNAALFADNFNRASIGAGWVISGSGWTLANGFLRSGSGQRQVVIDNGGPYADFSFSSVFSSTDSAGDVGFIFRAQDAQNYYRFLWNRGGSGVGGVTNGFVIQRVVNDIPTTLASSAAGGYTTYRWHHVEIRSVGNTFTVYIDGAPVLSATDPLEQFSSGGVGFFTHLQTYAFFDNALVTRMGATGCPVALGDVVTYTLTISNLERLVGHNLIITDILPSATEMVTYTAGSSDGASSILSGPAAGATGVLTWAVDRLNPATPFNPLNNSMLQITVTVRIRGDVAAGDRLINQALLSYDGQAGTGPFGIERSYSGGSHSAALRTPDAAIIKSSYPPTATIGQTLQYTITFPGVGGIAANLYTATLTDVLPVGFRMVGTPQVVVTPANIPPGGVNVSNSTTKTAIIQFTQIPSYTQATVVITAVVENLPVNQDGVQYTNTATLGWRNGQGEPIEPVTSNPVTTTIVEPALIIEKSAYPTSLRPGDTVFYTLRIHHAPTSTAPAYNVLISDTLSSALSYISGSWEANNSPTALAATGLYTVDLPNLQAYFPLLDLSVTQNNPLILRYQGVVNLSVEPGTLITNVAGIQWTSLPTDAFGLGEIRDGSGGLNDYSEEDEALISLDQFTIVKTGPLTVTAGAWVTYVILVGNGSPFTGTNARVVDMISFRVQDVTGTFSTSVASGLCVAPTQAPNAGSEIVCNLGDMPPFSTGVVTITGRIDPEVPDGALVDDYATFYIVDSNGVMQSRSDEAETQVESETDLALTKSGPLTATAGGMITYTLVVTNYGPSTARGVDAKDILPPGLTFLGGSSTSGACTSSICQIGDMAPGEVVTMVITASVGSDVTGVITNAGQVFAATYDPNLTNNRDSATTTVLAVAEVHVLKTDFADPVYAGDMFLYQLLVTNTGPSLARSVILTDTLPEPLIFQGGSPGCQYIASTRQVVCVAGDVPPGGWYGALINVMVPTTATHNSVVTNRVELGTTTQVLSATSTLSDSEATTLLQKSGNPTNLVLRKLQTPASLVAGSTVSGVITYTVVVTNEGPSPASGVNIFDLYPVEFDLLSITASKPLTGAGCTVAASCLIGSLEAGEAVTVTIVMRVNSHVASGVYTNTAFVASAAPDLNPNDNSESVAATVVRQANLQINKAASPSPVRGGETLIYQITVTNTGPSDASNVVVTDALPIGFSPALVLSSQGGCAGLPCTLGVLKPNEAAWVQVIGTVWPSATTNAALANTAVATATEAPVAVQAAVTPTLLLVADLAVSKAAPATALPGASVVYTLTATNLGPSIAPNVRITDALPSGATLVGVSGCTNIGSGQQVVCALGDLAVGAMQTIRITATVDADVSPGTSLENVATITGDGSDPNPLNNVATADTGILGAASFEIVKRQSAPTGAVTAGEWVTYTITFTNTGPGVARMVDVKDQLPPGFSLVNANAGVQGFCAGAICQYGALPVGATRTMTVVARTDSSLAAGVATNVAAVFSVDANAPATATAQTTITTAASLTVDKIALNNPVYAGGAVLYQVIVTNNGPSDAQNVIITDTLPANMNYAGGDAACSAMGALITCAIGVLPAGANRILLIQVNIDSQAGDGLALTNLVTATSPTSAAPVTATATVTVVQPTGGDADLALSKTGPATAVAGEPITYTFVVTNYGPADAIDVQVVDALPDGVRFVSAVASQGVCAAGVSCQLGELALDAIATITVVGVVESDVVSGVTLVNVARVDAANGDPVSGNNQDSVSTGVQAEALVRMTKEVFPAVTAPGASVAYRIVVTNSGPSAARNIVVTDMLPPEVTNAIVSSSRGGCTGFPCSLGDLAPGDSATILVSGVVAQAVTGPFTNTASLATTTALASGSVTNAGATVVVTALADLLLVLESSPTMIAGGTGVVTATVSNLGPSTADGAVVTVTLPAGAGFLGANLPSGWYVASDVGGVIVLTTTNSLSAGVSTLLPITVTIDSAIQPGVSLQFNGQVAAQTSDPNPTNNSANADASVIGQADLIVTKVGPATAVAGALVTYTVLVANAGPTAAVLRDVKDALPSGVTLLSAMLARSDGSTTACAAAICQTLAPLAVGEVATMTVVGRVDANVPAGAVLTNTAMAFTEGVTPDPNPTNNTASATTVVSTSAALRVEKVAFNNPVYAGDVIFYQIVVYNDGPSDAQNVVVTDVLPSSTTYLGGDVACAHAAGVVTCNLGALAAGSSRSLQVLARVDAAAPHGLIVTNGVTAASPTAATPVTAAVGVTVQQPAFGAVDLAIEKNGPVTATAGTFITYTLVVTNRGPAVANAVQVVDALPYAVIGMAASASQGVCNNSVVCQLGDLAVGASATVTITGWVRTETDHGATLLNVASVSSNNVEQTSEDNVASLTTSVEASVLMTIEKTAQPTVVTPGGALSYRILVRNLGPSLARNVVMTDLLPLELESPLVSSARGYCNFNVCYLGDLPPGETVTILVMGNASSAASASFTNTALLTTTTPIHPASVIQAQARTDVGDNADLIMFKAAQATVSAGSPVTYVLTVRNAGPSTAVNVQVQDALPPDVVIADLGGCANAGPGSVLCPPTPLVSLTAGSEISWTIVVSTSSDLPVGTTLQNRATVSSDTPDPNLVNNTAIAETSIIGQSNLGVHKAASSPTVAAGNELTYTVVVTNAGPSDAVSVRLVDILPPEVQLLRPIEVERSLLPGVPVICLDTVCETGVVREAEILTFTLHVRVNPAVTHQTLFTNTATIYSPSDPDFSNNIARAAVLAERQSTLVITKQASPDPAITGALLSYQIKVRNQGPSTADGVLVGDLLPAGFTLTSVSSSQGGCSSLPCALGSLPPNEEATITIVGMVDPLQSAALVNTAAVTATTPLTNLALSQVTITTTVSALANLSLLLNSAPTAIAGLTTTVQAQVINLGPSSAVGTIVTLTLPAGAAYQDVVLPPNWYATPNADNTVTLTTTEILSPGAGVPLWVQVRFEPGVQPGSSLEFVGEISSQTPDNNLTDNYATTDVSVIAQADLVIYKTGPDALLAGAPVTYIITAENRGPSAASVRDLKDALPAGVALQSATLEVAGGGLTACVDAICQVQRPLTVGEVVTMTVVGLVDPTLPDGATLTNTATVFAENLTPDPNESNNQAHHAAPVVTLAQIGLDKYDLTDPVEPDGLLVYAVVVTNTGPSLARNVVVTDALPPHVTYHSTTGPCSEAAPGTVVCTIGDLAVGARMLFLIVVKVNATAPNGFLLRNTATMTSATPLTHSTLFADEATRVLRSGGPQADLEVIKTTDATSVSGGGEVTFTLHITNHGPSPVRNVQLLDLLPGGLTLVRVQTSQGFCNAGVTCLLGGLDFAADADGNPAIVGSAVVTIVAQAAVDLADGAVLTNTAYVQSELVDPAPDNNLDDASVTVSARFADVAVRKSGALYATAGEVITYTLTVENAGPAIAQNVTLVDPMPQGVRYLAATPAPTSGSLDQPIWQLGSLAAGGSIVVELVVQVDPQAPPALLIVNTAYVSSTTPDLNLSNNQATATTQSYGAADLEVIKTADREIVYGDDVVHYTITVNNLGPSLSDRVDVKELLPPGVELLSLNASQGACVSAICQVGNIPVGEPVVITAAVRIISPTFPPGTVLTNTAVAFTNTPDPNPANNESSDGVTVGPVVNLAALKMTRVQTAVVGTAISYTVLVTNYGPSEAPVVIITDHLPYRFVYLSSNAVNGCVQTDEVTLVCNAGPLPAQRSLAVDIYFFISALGGERVRNRIVVDAPGSDLGGLGRPESELEIPANPVPTAILLETYTLEKSDDAFILRWKTLSEFRVWGFRLWRGVTPDVNQATLLTPQGIPASGVGNTYTYLDRDVEPGVTYWYWLETLTVDGGGWMNQALIGRLGPDALLYLPLVTYGEPQVEVVLEETPTPEMSEPTSAGADASHAGTAEEGRDAFGVRLPLILIASDAGWPLQPEPATSPQAETGGPPPPATAVETPTPTAAPPPPALEAPSPTATPTPPDAGSATSEASSSPWGAPTPLASARADMQTPSPTATPTPVNTPTPIETNRIPPEGAHADAPEPVGSSAPEPTLTDAPSFTPTPSTTAVGAP